MYTNFPQVHRRNHIEDSEQIRNGRRITESFVSSVETVLNSGGNAHQIRANIVPLLILDDILNGSILFSKGDPTGMMIHEDKLQEILEFIGGDEHPSPAKRKRIFNMYKNAVDDCGNYFFIGLNKITTAKRVLNSRGCTFTGTSTGIGDATTNSPEDNLEALYNMVNNICRRVPDWRVNLSELRRKYRETGIRIPRDVNNFFTKFTDRAMDDKFMNAGLKGIDDWRRTFKKEGDE